MGLKGYTRRTGICKGGITHIAVAYADAVSLVEFDMMTGNVIDLQLSEGENFALYNFKEDSAALIEETVISAGFTHTRRELSFQLERLDDNAKQTVVELLKKSAKGYIIIALNGCGTSYILGYSRRLGGRFPMQVQKTEASTGNAPDDTPAETVVFYNEDCEKAPVFTGDFPHFSQ